MRIPLWMAALVVLCPLSGLSADSLIAEAEGSGTVVLWFLGQDVTADVRANVTLAGTLVSDGTQLPFSATADASGTGYGNLSTLAVDGWVALTGNGETESGLAVSLRGGISVDALDPATSSTSGQGSGRFYLLITIADRCWLAEGKALGSAAGEFVVPDDPVTMELAGSGSFMLSGDAHLWTPAETSAVPDWPSELIAALERHASITAPAKVPGG